MVNTKFRSVSTAKTLKNDIRSASSVLDISVSNKLAKDVQVGKGLLK